MGFFATIGQFFKNLFAGKKSRQVEKPSVAPPPRPVVVPGLENAEVEKTRLPAYRSDYSNEFFAPHEDEFIFFGAWLMTPGSSNVAGFHYNYAARTMTVEYCGWSGKRSSRSAFYEYFEVHEFEARRAYTYASKGGWVWDDLRIRNHGRCAHNKEYVFLPSPSNWEPKNPC